MRKQGKSLEKIYDWEGNWEWLFDKYSYLFPDDEREWTPKGVREYLNNKDWSNEDIWQALIEICDEKVGECTDEIESLNKQNKKNKLKLQVIRKLGCVASKDELNRLLRYEGAIERQLYKAMNQLERLQRMRAGDNVPAPIKVDVDVNTDQNS